MNARARSLVDRLGLAPHPEGGFYREIFRSDTAIQPLDARPPRAALTTIYFLLAAGQSSRWHRVLSDEVWHFYEGDPLELFQAPSDLGGLQRTTLGPSGGDAEPVHVVPAGWWQAARPSGAFSLVGCTVGPGFDFADFSLLRDDRRLVAALSRFDAHIQALL